MKTQKHVGALALLDTLPWPQVRSGRNRSQPQVVQDYLIARAAAKRARRAARKGGVVS